MQVSGYDFLWRRTDGAAEVTKYQGKVTLLDGKSECFNSEARQPFAQANAGFSGLARRLHGAQVVIQVLPLLGGRSIVSGEDEYSFQTTGLLQITLKERTQVSHFETVFNHQA